MHTRVLHVPGFPEENSDGFFTPRRLAAAGRQALPDSCELSNELFAVARVRAVECENAIWPFKLYQLGSHSVRLY